MLGSRPFQLVTGVPVILLMLAALLLVGPSRVAADSGKHHQAGPKQTIRRPEDAAEIDVAFEGGDDGHPPGGSGHPKPPKTPVNEQAAPQESASPSAPEGTESANVSASAEATSPAATEAQESAQESAEAPSAVAPKAQQPAAPSMPNVAPTATGPGASQSSQVEAATQRSSAVAAASLPATGQPDSGGGLNTWVTAAGLALAGIAAGLLSIGVRVRGR